MASWIKLSYPRRLFLWLLGYSLLLSGGFVAFQCHREKEFKQRELNARLQGINTEILSGLEQGNPMPPPSTSFPGLRVSIIAPDGTVVSDNSIDHHLAANHLNREEIVQARQAGEGFTVRRHSESTGENYFYSATRGRSGYIVRTAVPYSESLSELLRADYGFLWSMGLVSVVMCVLGFFATRRVGLHIRRLNRFAEKAERGERIYDMAPFPTDELGAISNHIVRLYASLQQAVADRDAQHKAALHEQQEKERIKKQLTQNINHELKTPVAAIQVCLETVMSHPDMAAEKQQEFLQRCRKNVERLRNLLTDVALITRMDDGAGSILMESVDLTALIAGVVGEAVPAAALKGMCLRNEVAQPATMSGNASLLESVFRNLIDNAIAYSGGSEVTVSLCENTPRHFVVVVADNGSGIPDEHLGRIFERFYRIDKGRSRAAGGTGLGLSIVKNAVLLHGGTITVANLPTGGLRFTITLPKS